MSDEEWENAHQRRNEFFEEALGVLKRKYEHLAAREPEKAHPAHLFSLVVAQISGVGVRHLQAVKLLMDSGFDSEVPLHIRTAWECGIDLAYIMAQRGTERRELARKYQAMAILRSAPIMASILNMSREEWLSGLASECKEVIRSHESALEAIDVRTHWTGLDKGEVRSEAYRHLDALLGEGIGSYSKMALFDVGSGFAHADPGVLFMTPAAKQKPTLGASDRVPAFGDFAAFATLPLLFVVCERLGGSHRNEANEVRQKWNRLVAQENELTTGGT